MTSPPPNSKLLDVLKKPMVAGPLGLLAVVVLLFGDLALLPATKILSSARTDVPTLFLHWREWGFGQLLNGHLPLWNPHVAGGYPFFGGFQSALLYPLNWHYLFLNIGRAINFDIVLHVYLCGFFFYIWALRRQLHPLAAFLAAVCVMLGGPFYMHVYPGHLSPLAVMAWAPVVLMAVDELTQRPALRWGVVGAFAIAMQVLAGYPQIFFYTAVAAALLALANLWWNRRTATVPFWKLLAAMVLMYVGGVAMSALQLLPGLDAATESVRSSGVSLATASTFSFPPENLLTALSPSFLGDVNQSFYWGRGYLWEACLYSGIACTLMAILSLMAAKGPQRAHANRYLLLTVVLLIFALGSHTPLFNLLYTYVPGFGSFRGSAKFIFFAALFGAMLVGLGFDSLLKGELIRRRHFAVVGAAGVAVALLASFISSSALQGTAGTWGRALAAIPGTGESFQPTPVYSSAEFVSATGGFAASSLYVTAGICIVVAVLLGLQKFSRVPAYLLAMVAVGELAWFALSHRPVFDLEEARQVGLHNLRPPQNLVGRGDEVARYVKLGLDYTSDANGYNIGGYDPYILKRYAEFIASTQGKDADKAEAYLYINEPHRLYRMLRLRFVIEQQKDDVDARDIQDALPQALLVPSYRLAPTRDQVFTLLKNDSFNPRRDVILELEPAIKPDGDADTSRDRGSARVVERTSDSLTIEADTPIPQILLVTDNYSKDWRAVALPGSVQQQYQIQPANYILRAIPLSAGKHRLRLEYAPTSLVLGAWISGLAWLVFLGAAVQVVRLRRGGRGS